MNRTLFTLILTANLTVAIGQTQTPTETPATATPQTTTEPDVSSILAQAKQLAAQARTAYPNAANINRPLWKSAVDASERAVSQAPHNTEALRLRAELYSEIAFWRRAEVAWRAYFAVAGTGDEAARQKMSDVLYNLGFAAYQRSELSEASKLLSESISFAANLARNYVWAARVELENGNAARAAELYERLTQLDPKDALARYFLDVAKRATAYGVEATSTFSRGYRAFELGNKEQALEEFRIATAAAPSFLEAHRMRARIALELGLGAEARTAWEAVTQLEGENATNKYFLEFAREVERFGLEATQAFRNAYTRYQAGDRIAAEAGFLAATAASPQYAKAWAWLGRTRFERQDFQGAAQAYRQAIALDPNDQSSAYFLRLAEAKLR